MKIAVKKRYVCPASEVFEMKGKGVLLAESEITAQGGAGGGACRPGRGDAAI